MSQLQSITRNPFATRRTRPGKIPYVFCDDQLLSDLAHRLKQQNWMGQIVGPHGSGKTTLLESLLPVCASQLDGIHRITLHNGQRRLPLSAGALERLSRGSLLVIDGYEQLSRMSRGWLGWQLRRRGFGLLVTTHAPVALPLLYRTPTSPTLTRAIVFQLANTEDSGITDADIRSTHDRHSGNVREVLFDLYDLFQQRLSG